MSEQPLNDECPECRSYEERRRQARRAGDHSRATDCEVLRRRHPDHTVYRPIQGEQR